ncbi:phage/plasmid replication domain-containing protein [Achromobacter sp. ESBL13]|uniref:phage/plasmid replication domain-containing protein n=1 Tax=Achromobacter sp. ESBL13 TaxID=3077328 RepID=UPI002FC99CBC
MKISIPRSEDVGIDTVTLRLPYVGDRLSTSYCQTITSDGEVRPGASHSISLKGKNGAHTVKAWHLPNSQELKIEGTPNGYVYGQNLFSDSNIHASCERMLRRMSRDDRLACVFTTNSWRSASVDRVDLFINLRFEDNREAAKVLKQLGLQFAAQHKSVAIYATSAYWNPGKGKSYQVICYAKGLQLQAKRQRMQTKNEFLDKITDEANGIVRIELRLRKPELEKLGLTALTAWEANTPRRLFRKYFERLPIFNVAWGPIRAEELGAFSMAERRFYSLYKLGAPLDEHYAPRIIRKYMAKFRSFGIDLNVPSATAEALQLGELFSASNRIATVPEWMLAAGRAPGVLKKIGRAEQRVLHRLRRRTRSTLGPTLDRDPPGLCAYLGEREPHFGRG